MFFAAVALFASVTAAPAFDVVALGVEGGLVEGDLTSFAIKPAKGTAWLALDAGALSTGLAKSHLAFSDLRAFCLTHPHLDHVEGLAINVVDATGVTPVYGLPSTIDSLRDHVFNGVIWPAFGNESPSTSKPLSRLRYERVAAGRPAHLDAIGVTIEAWPLSHGGSASTAFIVDDGDSAVVFVGDTGPDLVEGGAALDHLWQRIAPLVRGGKLRGIFIETSYSDERKDELLFGHLTPRHLMIELQALAAAVGPTSAQPLRGLPVVIMHIKPTASGDARAVIEGQLNANNKPGVKLIVPKQGERFSL